VLQRGKAVRIRLNGIDCPEKGQPFGKAAKQFTSEMTLGKPITVAVKHLEKEGLLVADVILPDGSVLNEALVETGLAWRFGKDGKRPVLSALGQEEGEDKAGVWGVRNP